MDKILILSAVSPGFLYIKTEQHNIAVLHNVILAFQTDQSLFFCRCMRTACHQIVIAYHLGTDKSSLKIGMDLAGCLRRFCSLLDGPGADSPVPRPSDN